jgi:hypothetical protein
MSEELTYLREEVERQDARIQQLEEQLRDLMLVTLQSNRRHEVVTDPAFDAALVVAREERDGSHASGRYGLRLLDIAKEFASRKTYRGAIDTLLAFARCEAALEGRIGERFEVREV